MKKFYVLIIIFFVFFSNSSCKITGKYDQFKAYPLVKNFKIKAGESSFIAIKIEIPRDGYIYANPKGPGIGKATEVHPEKLENILFKETQFLPGEKYRAPGEIKHVWVYTNETILFVPFSVKQGTVKGAVNALIAVDALFCNKKSCIPQSTVIDYPITIIENTTEATKYTEELQEKFFNSRPPRNSDFSGKSIGENDDNDEFYFENIDFKPRFISTGISGIIQGILYGLLAGLLLNIMPCVLPVVSIKLMSFVSQSGKSRRELFFLSGLFSIGIITSFVILAILAAFFGYNWGGLFQNEFFLLAMIGLVFSLALSMFGIFSINIPTFAGKAVSRNYNQYADSFLKGLLATLLATPCSGPFLGGTLAWAFTQPPLIIFVIFISVGFGMSLPYLITGIFPALIRFIPKPGQWMNTFENIMAFLLMFTAVYLIGILPEDSVKPSVLFCGFIAAGLWQWGKYGNRSNSMTSRIVSFVIAVIIISGGYYSSFNYFYRADGSESIGKNYFTAEKFLKNKDAGKSTLVKFTADWCPNCKLVEKMSLETPYITQLIRDRGIDLMTADITKKNPPAEELLKKLGNYSIPVLALFLPGDEFLNPICLRDIYSEEDVAEIIKSAGVR